MRAREQTERGMKERKPSAKEGRKEEQYHATCREYDDFVLVTVMYSHCNLRVAPECMKILLSYLKKEQLIFKISPRLESKAKVF